MYIQVYTLINRHQWLGLIAELKHAVKVVVFLRRLLKLKGKSPFAPDPELHLIRALRKVVKMMALSLLGE